MSSAPVRSPDIRPRMLFFCNGKEVQYKYAVVPGDVECRLELVGGGEEDPIAPHISYVQRGSSSTGFGSITLLQCGKCTWRFIHRAYTLSGPYSEISFFVAHPSLQNIHKFEIQVVDESKGYFSVFEGHKVNAISFAFDEGLQLKNGGIFSGFSPVLPEHREKRIKFFCKKNGVLTRSPAQPYLILASEPSDAVFRSQVQGVRVGDVWMLPVEDEWGGTYEAMLSTKDLVPAEYHISVKLPLSDHIFGYTNFRVVSREELKAINREKREFRQKILASFMEVI